MKINGDLGQLPFDDSDQAAMLPDGFVGNGRSEASNGLDHAQRLDEEKWPWRRVQGRRRIRFGWFKRRVPRSLAALWRNIGFWNRRTRGSDRRDRAML